MYTTENNAMTVQQNAEQKFILPDMVESDFSPEDMADDMDGLSMSFNRVKIPAGGSIQFEIPTDDPENPDYTKVLEGVILFNHATCAYWPPKDDDDEDVVSDEDNNPLCSSLDGKIGVGTPGGSCAICPLNAYGTAEKGKGKACKNMRIIYLLRSGEYLPLQFNLPPTSIKSFREFMNRAFRLRNRNPYGSVVEIKLKKENNGKQDYSVATFRRLYDFHGEELAKVRAYANNFKAQILALNQQRTQANEEQNEDICEVAAADALPMGVDDDEPFVINGDRDVLPG